MTQPALLISAPRSVPDVCLALGIQLSVCGFLLVLRDGRASVIGLAAAFGGSAMAVLSKGVPGAAFIGLALVFLAWRSPALLKQDWPRWAAAAAIGLLAGGSWFALMTALHRNELAEQFTDDQLGTHRFAAHAWQPVVQLPLCAGLLIAMAGPWLLAAWPAWRRSEARMHLTTNSGVKLLLCWCAVYCGLAATINHVTPRYLLPAAAPLSILIGGLLAETESERLRQWLHRGAVGMTVCAIGSAAMAGLLWNKQQVWLLIGAAATAIAIGSFSLRTRQWTAPLQAVVIACAMNAALLGAGLAISAWRGAGIAGPVSNASAARIVFAGEAGACGSAARRPWSPRHRQHGSNRPICSSLMSTARPAGTCRGATSGL
jgi:4-amino-4-deoxy-L-arabinose transferase-like glycosyltransferase